MGSFATIISKYGSFKKNYRSNLIKWDYWDLLFVHSGELTISFNNILIVVKQGQSILIPPGTYFTITSRNFETTASVQYFNSDNSEVNKTLCRFSKPLLHKDKDGLALESHIKELIEVYDSNKHILKRQELLLELVLEKILAVKYGRKESNSPWSDISIRYKNRLYNPPSITEIASWAGYSPSRFRFIFKRDTGLKPAVFFFNIKIQSSAKMLIETVLPIKEISQKHGYNEVAHFNRAFTRFYNISPGKYRKKNTFCG
ncbi:MAG: AraC family transcriptional regulator [Spirochaetaceae bacterium]